MQTVKDATTSLDLKKDFVELVQQFSSYVKCGSEYLVITIDDIDMNIDKGFEVIEDIYHYLMIPNVIILMGFDMMQFTEICFNYFEKIVPKETVVINEFESRLQGKKQDLPLSRNSSANYSNEYWIRRISNITLNYIDKIFPYENRVFLKGIQSENKDVIIKGYLSEGFGEGKGTKDSIPAPAKWVILHKLYRRTGIICDVVGKKKHYYEPDTLRQLLSFLELLEKMNICIKIKGDYFKTETQRNLQEQMYLIFKDISERMEGEKLYYNERDYFDMIRRSHFSRQASQSMHIILSHIEMDKVFPLGITYNYGNYTYVLNVFSNQCDNKKGLLHLILAQQTASLSDINNRLTYLNYIRNNSSKLKKDTARAKNDIKEIEKEYKTLIFNMRELMGSSITGDWFIRMMNNTMESDLESVQKLIFADELSSSASVYPSLMPGIESPTDITKVVKIPIPDWIFEDAKSLVNYISVIVCLFPAQKSGLFHVVKINPESQPEAENGLSCDRKYYDPFGFVMEALDYDTHIGKVGNIINSLKSKHAFSEVFEKSIEKEKNALSQKYKKWQLNNGCNFAIPVYSLDVYYNLLKRLYVNKPVHWDNCEDKWIVEYNFANLKIDKKIGLIAETAYFRVIKRMYIKLNEIDEYYYNPLKERGSIPSDAMKMQLGENLRSCPFIQNLGLVLCSSEEKKDETVIWIDKENKNNIARVALQYAFRQIYTIPSLIF